MKKFCEYVAFFEEAISFYKSGQIVQESVFRVSEETDLFGPVIYLYRHSAELLLKALLIRILFKYGHSDLETIRLKTNKRKLSSTHSIRELYVEWKSLGGEACLDQYEADILEYYINNVDHYDKDSTFFRYPVDRKGNRNKRAFTETLDEDILKEALI